MPARPAGCLVLWHDEGVRLRLVRRPPAAAPTGISAVARVDARTKRLTTRLAPGEIAVIDHVDLDRVSAEALVACRPAAVLNAAPSISGRYPNLGPEILVAAGVPLIDSAGPELLHTVRDGQLVYLDGATLRRDGRVLATGVVQTEESVAEAMAEARAGLAVQLEAFAGNTMEYLRRERELLLDGVGVPEVRTRFTGRHTLVVVRGYHYKDDLHALRAYIREYRPVLVGVDGGADALRENGYAPDMIVGDMDSVSDAALRSGAELVVHAYRDGTAPGLPRLQDLGLDPVIFPAMGTSEDVAMLLADDKGAELIVAVGTHTTLVEFLDKGRAGMASTFLTRLRLGGKFVDAKGVSQLYRQRISTLQIALLIVTALITLLVAISVTEVGQAWLNILRDRIDGLLFWMQGWL